MTKERKRGIILLVFFGLLIISIPVFMFLDYKQSEEAYKKYEALYEGTNVIYLGREGCGYCKLFGPVMEKLAKDYQVTYKYVDTDTLKNGFLEKAVKKAEIDEERFGTPTLIITGEGKAKATHIGFMEREDLFDFLKENGIIGSDASYVDDYPNLTKINYADYETLLRSGQKSLVVIGQTNCSHCIEAKPILDEYAKESGVVINYLNYTDMTSEQKSNLQSSVSYFKENEKWGTPLFLILENGDSVASMPGFAGKEQLVTFLRDNGMI